MSNIDEARAQLEEGLFDSDSSNDDDSQKSSSSDEESDDDDTSSSVNLKPALKKGDRVVAAWWDLSRNEGVNSTDGKWFSGKVHAVKERDRYSGSRASKYGPIRIYDIHYDDGDELEGILDVFVCPENDHELENNTNSRDWKGVRNVKDRASSDRYTKEIGWYVAIIDGEEKSFSTLYEAMKKSDEYTIKVKKGGVRKSDLNLPNEWKLPNKKKRGRPKKVNKEEDNPVKKKKKPDMKEIFDDTGSDSDDDMEDIRESSGADRVESLPVVGEPNYTGVYTSTKIGVYRSLFQDKNHVQKSAGVYMLKADAAHARDECCKELEGLLRKGPNFNTLEEYKIARDREMEARGISLKEVGTLSEMSAQIQEKRNEHGESRQRSNDENEGESADDESLASDQVESLPGVGEPNYTGAVKSHKSGVYRSLIYEKSNGVWGQKSAGVYTLKADAAHARDECSRELGGFPAKGGPNFNTVEEYKIARAREIEARGLSLKEVGTLSEMSAQIQEKRNEHGESRQRSNDENEGESADESLAADQDKDEESVDVGSKLSGKGEETKYTGVSFITSIDRYRGFNWYNNKSNSLGEFVLAADAAHSRDEFCRVMNVTKKGFNFSTEEEYKRARTMEINRRGLSLDKAGSSTGILAKIQARRTKWIESRQRNDDEDYSSQSSSDDLPLIAMKTKRRRSASPKETVVKTSSDYRGVKYNQRKEKHWTVSIFYNGKDRFVGVYDLETDAARVHDEVAAILVSNDDPNFATKSDHEQARKREAETLGLNLEMIDSFQASMEKAQIYVNSLLSGAEHVAQGVPRKTRSASPFTPILSDCEMRSEASPVENVKGSSRKIADLNEAMTMKWGRRLPAAGSLFIDSYQQNLCEMLGGVVDESSKTPIGTFVSICTVQSADGQEEHDRDLDGGESTHDSPRIIDMKTSSDFGDKLSGGQVENNIDKGIVEKEKLVERHENLVEAGHDIQGELTVEKNKPVKWHDNLIVAGHDNQDEGILEKTKPDERHEILVGAGYDIQGAEKVDLSKDVKKKKEVKYAGVCKLKGSNRYRAQMWYNGKTSSMGDFVLNVDAAHSRDVFCRSFGLNKPLNFNTQEEYKQARATEIEQRGLTLYAADTLAKKKEVTLLSDVATRIKAKKAKWDAESKKSNSDAPVLPEQKSQSKQTTQDDSDDNISLFSEANDEQEGFVQSQDSAAITVAASNVTAATVKPNLSEMNLVSVTKEQAESLDFPIGCEVLWKLQDESFQRGVVALAWLNMTQTISLVYEVEPLSGESKQMKCASELAFDTRCPVYIKSSPTDNNALVEGEVLLSRTDGKKTLYTILVKKEGNEFQLKHDVPSDLVGFRKITNKNNSPSRRVTDVSEPNNQDLHSEQAPAEDELGKRSPAQTSELSRERGQWSLRHEYINFQLNDFDEGFGAYVYSSRAQWE
mmetsp:Transcript_31938/g.54481  ORF Transcript_31938/g.54481 Transcript_31938/m.54481 type:complete len:1426 (-) Transcript_31938:917-5194(-)